MSKRKLKRQLSLAQIVMLGTAGTIGAEIFVLTGHAAGLVGPAAILAMLLAGVLTYSVALNYCELATTYPVTGGAMSYVREAYGTGILSYLVGSMDCLSSTFYAALSAVGFAHSLQIFIPGIPIVPTAIVVIGLFVVLNILGVTQIGNAQVLLGDVLLALFGVYLLGGFLLPGGFSWETFLPDGRFFIHEGVGTNAASLLQTVALVYMAYVGFEVIADDAEEAKDPNRTLPRGILISLTLVTLLNILTVLVTLGTVPWSELAGSSTALTDVVSRFMPGWGIPLMGVAGIIATLTSINTGMLSATREAFTLGRDGVWPHMFSRLTGFRTPYVSILIIGAISALIAAIGVVDFLSYISGAGYLFVLFCANLAMLRLHKLHPNLERPFKVPAFPLTPYLAAAAGVLIVAFTEGRALLFGAGVLAILTLLHYIGPPLSRYLGETFKPSEPPQDRVLIPVANPATAKGLLHLASDIAQASEDTYLCLLNIVSTSSSFSGETRAMMQRTQSDPKAFLEHLADYAREKEENLALYTKLRSAPKVSKGLLDEIKRSRNVKLVIAGWPGPLRAGKLADNPVKVLLQQAHTNVAVLLNRGLDDRGISRILVPVGGGLHSRMAVRLACELAEVEDARVTALRVLTEESEEGEAIEELEDKALLLAEIVEEVLGSVPETFSFRAVQAGSVPEGVLTEAARQPYDLIIMGASGEWLSDTRLFGSVSDWIADRAPCSVLFCRRYEPVGMAWLRRQVKQIGGEKPDGSTAGPQAKRRS
ncbi:MAG: amino acid permease [Anaerolineae bacterium]|jgi:amino acid transporter/nucleotide-binding universal stress UspA family protein|nr:amino acid permease [Anaerolineae bacterium]